MIKFCKYQGCGNDFILIDNRDKNFTLDDTIIRRLCHRQHGIGADGVILLGRSKKSDASMRIFNADGSEAEMCGNGLRCFGRFMQSLGIEKSQVEVEVMERCFHLFLDKNLVSVEMGLPQEARWDLEITVDQKKLIGHYLNTGVPHVVIFTENLKEIDLNHFGPKIRNDELFQPKGANVNFAQILENGNIKIRTYERGVEAETMACGTGATAVAYAAYKKHEVKNPIEIITKSGEMIRFDISDSTILMTGPAVLVYRGEFAI